MPKQTSDIIAVTTPYGHEVTAELDYTRFALYEAKVANKHTGIMKPLDAKTTETLARALKAKRVYEHAVEEARGLDNTLRQFSKVAAALGNDHPALAPYFQEAQQHRQIAEDMGARARTYYAVAMKACDDLAGY